ncbi:MAG: preprotein translocase subunit SecE [Planctomycetes bacterium]|nr:preprotein translocase subunit SecE [Planctomycetota bacterium]
MVKYKPNQGSYARTASFLLLATLAVFAAVTLYWWLLSFRAADGGTGFMGRDLSGGPLPVLSLALTPALLLAAALGAGLLWGTRAVLERPKVADLLIDCETEMRKCTWPTGEETWKSSLVVLLVVAFFTVALAGMDLLLNFAFSRYVF